MTSIKRIASHCLFANLQITIQPSRLCAYERSNYSEAMSEAFFWWFLLGRRQENVNITIVFFRKDFTFIKCNLQVDFAPLNAEIRQRQYGSLFWWFLLGRKQENINITILFFHSDVLNVLLHRLFIPKSSSISYYPSLDSVNTKRRSLQ